MFQEYPKWINIPGHEQGGVVAFSAEEESAIKAESSVEEVKRKPGRPKKAE